MAPEPPPRVPATEGVKEGTGCGPGPEAPDAEAPDMAGCKPCAVRLGPGRLQLPASVPPPPPPAAVSRDIMLPTTFCGREGECAGFETGLRWKPRTQLGGYPTAIPCDPPAFRGP